MKSAALVVRRTLQWHCGWQQAFHSRLAWHMGGCSKNKRMIVEGKRDIVFVYKRGGDTYSLLRVNDEKPRFVLQGIVGGKAHARRVRACHESQVWAGCRRTVHR